MSDTPLHILVTRPAEQAGELCRLLEENGFSTSSLPAIEVIPVHPDASAKQLIEHLDQFNKVIVISPNAARLGMPHIDDFWPQYPDKQNWFSIGGKTATELERFNIHAQQPESGFTSEDLLALKGLQSVKNEKILVIRGIGGREKLAEELKARGATVDYLEVYRRDLPPHSREAIISAFTSPEPDLVQASSIESIDNLARLAEASDIDILHIPVIVGSERVAAFAREKKFKSVIIAEDASNESIVQAIKDWPGKNPWVFQPGATAQAEQEAEPKVARKTEESQAIKEDKAPEAPPIEEEAYRMNNSSNKTASRRGATAGSVLHVFLTLALLAATGGLYYDLYFTLEPSGPVNRVAQLEARIQFIRKDLDSNTARVEQLSESTAHLVKRLNDLSESQRSQWLATEAQSLIQLAHQRLVLVQDPRTAYTLLASADRVLAQVNTANVTDLRRILAEDMLQLKKAAEVDVEGIFMRLDALRSEITNMTVADRSLKHAAEMKQAEDPDEGFFSKLLRKLNRYFIVTDHEGASPPVLSAQEQFFSRQQAIILVEQTQLALLQGKEKIYNQSMEQTINWVDRHFANDAVTRKAMLDELGELKGMDISPALPDIQRSLKGAQDFLDIVRQQSPPETGTTQMETSTG